MVTNIKLRTNNLVHEIPVIHQPQSLDYIQAGELQDYIQTFLNEIPLDLQGTLTPFGYMLHCHPEGNVTHQISFAIEPICSGDYLHDTSKYIKETFQDIFWDTDASPFIAPRVSISETMVTVQMIATE